MVMGGSFDRLLEEVHVFALSTRYKAARLRSVDKFQGQEGPVRILSVCVTYREYGSRGFVFILDRNRINAAISRAQCLAVVVADARITRATPASLDEIMLINLFCKLANHTSRMCC